MEQPQLAYKNNLSFGDVIVVYNPKSLLHRLIDKVTGRHTPFRAGHVAMFHEGMNIVEANSSGVNIKPCKNYTPHHLIYVRRCKTVDIAHIMILEKAIQDSIKEKYSFFQLPVIMLSYLFKRSMPDVSKKAVICSELIAGYYQKIGIKINRKTPQNVAPIDFLLDENFNTTYLFKP
jgi:uncharacterized protein YycO